MFDKNADKERRMNSDTLAEAIIDKGISKGFWVDKNYFDKANFGEILETALHELSHKAGGDESSVFSYKLTDVNSSVLKYLSSSPFGRKFFAILNKLWNEG